MANYNKLWVALVMSIVSLAAGYGFIPAGVVTESTVSTLVALATPFLVWLVPNIKS